MVDISAESAENLERIEVTPEMIEAGCAAAADFDSEELATETAMVVLLVYEAMRRCERAPGSQDA